MVLVAAVGGRGDGGGSDDVCSDGHGVGVSFGFLGLAMLLLVMVVLVVVWEAAEACAYRRAPHRRYRQLELLSTPKKHVPAK